jgi:hypothetical protein
MVVDGEWCCSIISSLLVSHTNCFSQIPFCERNTERANRVGYCSVVVVKAHRPNPTNLKNSGNSNFIPPTAERLQTTVPFLLRQHITLLI